MQVGNCGDQMPGATWSSFLTRAECRIGQVLCLLYCVYRKPLYPRGAGKHSSTNTVELELQQEAQTEEAKRKKGQLTETRHVTANSSKSKQWRFLSCSLAGPQQSKGRMKQSARRQQRTHMGHISLNKLEKKRGVKWEVGWREERATYRVRIILLMSEWKWLFFCFFWWECLSC